MSEHDQLCNLLADQIAAQRETTEAVIKLTEAIAGVRTKIDAPIKAAKEETTKAIEKAAAPAPTPAAPATTTPTAATAENAAPTADTATGIDLEYKRDVGPTMAELLAKKGAPFVVELLSQFGVKKGVELAKRDLAAALAAAKAALES